MKSLVKLLIYPPIFFIGIVYFFFTKKNFSQGFAALRFLFVLTNGRINDVCSRILSAIYPKYIISKTDGVLGQLSYENIENITNDIRQNGFHVFDKKLNDESIINLVNFAKETKVSYLDFTQRHIIYSKDKVLFEENTTLSPRFQFTNQEVFENTTIKQLVFDNSLLAIANSYLQAQPILDLAVMWWSVPFDAKAENKAAQMYHFDMDRFKFIKFFFYLNDVKTTNGPHCYVRSTHKRLPRQILADRRITDEEINNAFSPSDILELTGERGSIIAVDTRGLHKGKPLIEGKRLLFQIEFSNSLFGASYSKIGTIGLNENYKKIKQKYGRTYSLIE